MHMILLSCRKATELIEKKIFFGLSKKEKVQLFMHTSVCEYCARYQKQSKELDSLLKAHLNNDNYIDTKSLQTDLDKLKNKIHSDLNKK